MSEASGGNLYEAILGGAASATANRPPARVSAAVVPWRRAASGGIEVYWVKRGEALSFMGGWHAFPGGGLAKTDADLALAGTPAISETSATLAAEESPEAAGAAVRKTTAPAEPEGGAA